MKLWSRWSSKAEVLYWDMFPRTHRVALDWLFDRINSDPKIQTKYVDSNKSTRRHFDQKKLHTWWMEPPSVIVLHQLLQLSVLLSSHVEEVARKWLRREDCRQIETSEKFGIETWSLVSSWGTSLFSWWWWSSWWWWGIRVWEILIWYIIRFWSNQRLSSWFLWHLCMRVYSLTRSRPSPLPLFLWWLIIIAIIERNELRLGVVKVAEVTSHVSSFSVPLFLHHQQVMELEARRSWRFTWSKRFRRSTWSKRNIRIIKAFWRRRISGLISSFVFQV